MAGAIVFTNFAFELKPRLMLGIINRFGIDVPWASSLFLSLSLWGEPQTFICAHYVTRGRIINIPVRATEHCNAYLSTQTVMI